MSWPVAFALTQLIELPVYGWGARRAGGTVARGVVAGFAASTLTHPVLWFVVHPALYGRLGYAGFFAVGEGLVVAAEALTLRALGVPRPLRLALAANAVSATIGWLLAVAR